MPQQSVYVETTIISYYVSRPSRDLVIAARQALTREWWDEHRQKYRLVVSPVVARESASGDAAAADRRMALMADVEVLATDALIAPLADRIEAALRIPAPKAADAFHLAYAVHHKVDCLLTWNCAHFANPETERRLYDYCREHDLWLPVICTPEEMLAGKGVNDE